MSYVCFRCGNCEEFRGYRRFEEEGYEKLRIFNNGETLEVLDFDITDYYAGDIEDICCSNCGNKMINDIDNYRKLIKVIDEKKGTIGFDNELINTIKSNYLKKQKRGIKNECDENNTLGEIFSEV